MAADRTGISTGERGASRPIQPLGRGLQDVSHLFLSSHPPTATGGRPSDVEPETPASRPPSIGAGPPLSRAWLAGVLGALIGNLEAGLRAIEVGLPCHPCGEIDLLAVDRASHLTVIDFDVACNDALLLRGISHVDWVVHNTENLRRMHPNQVINVESAPRLIGRASCRERV